MSSIKISIVTISFNQFKYLPQAIESVRRQNSVSWELIIVDPGSTDGSREFAQSLAAKDNRVKLILESDLGPADGLNKGFKFATGEIIGYINSDDFYLENIFERVVAAFEMHPTSACIYAHGMVLENDKLRFQSSDRFTLNNYALRKGLVIQQSTFFNRKILESSKVQFNIFNKISWDGELLVDLGIAGFQITRVSDVWGVFRIHPSSITGSRNFVSAGEREFIRIREKITPLTGLSNWAIVFFALFRLFNSLNRRFLNRIRSYQFNERFK
jgi:glycosyltransferase involved in cell wall biosynthesis